MSENKLIWPPASTATAPRPVQPGLPNSLTPSTSNGYPSAQSGYPTSATGTSGYNGVGSGSSASPVLNEAPRPLYSSPSPATPMGDSMHRQPAAQQAAGLSTVGGLRPAASANASAESDPQAGRDTDERGNRSGQGEETGKPAANGKQQPAEAEPVDAADTAMLARLHLELKGAVLEARDLARSLRHIEVSPSHLLCVLVTKPAARAELKQLGIVNGERTLLRKYLLQKCIDDEDMAIDGHDDRPVWSAEITKLRTRALEVAEKRASDVPVTIKDVFDALLDTKNGITAGTYLAEDKRPPTKAEKAVRDLTAQLRGEFKSQIGEATKELKRLNAEAAQRTQLLEQQLAQLRSELNQVVTYLRGNAAQASGATTAQQVTGQPSTATEHPTPSAAAQPTQALTVTAVPVQSVQGSASAPQPPATEKRGWWLGGGRQG